MKDCYEGLYEGLYEGRKEDLYEGRKDYTKERRMERKSWKDGKKFMEGWKEGEGRKVKGR